MIAIITQGQKRADGAAQGAGRGPDDDKPAARVTGQSHLVRR